MKLKRLGWTSEQMEDYLSEASKPRKACAVLHSDGRQCLWDGKRWFHSIGIPDDTREEAS